MKTATQSLLSNDDQTCDDVLLLTTFYSNCYVKLKLQVHHCNIVQMAST